MNMNIKIKNNGGLAIKNRKLFISLSEITYYT
jgi:hypothetical protein